MSDWLNRKDVCQRCLSGIIEDGSCATCGKLDDNLASWLKDTRQRVEMWQYAKEVEAKIGEVDGIKEA